MTPDEIRADCVAGTPGPWRDLDDAGYTWKKWVVSPDGDAELGNWHIAFVTGQANARRIARLPELEDAYLALTDRVAQLEKALAAIELQGGLAETYDPVVSAICRTALTGEKP